MNGAVGEGLYRTHWVNAMYVRLHYMYHLAGLAWYAEV